MLVPIQEFLKGRILALVSPDKRDIKNLLFTLRILFFFYLILINFPPTGLCENGLFKLSASDFSHKLMKTMNQMCHMGLLFSVMLLLLFRIMSEWGILCTIVCSFMQNSLSGGCTKVACAVSSSETPGGQCSFNVPKSQTFSAQIHKTVIKL